MVLVYGYMPMMVLLYGYELGRGGGDVMSQGN